MARRMTKYSPKYIGNEKVRKNANTIIIKMIIRAFETVNDSSYDENQIRSKYLLGQIIRQYNIPVSNWHISEKAQKLWNDIVVKGEEIDGYDFQQLFSIDENCSCKEVGNIRIEKNKRYRFNQFFQAEHIIPVYVIKDELDKLVNDKSSKKKEKILIEDMRKVLENIHICRITRDEARRLPVKREVNDSSKKLDYSEYYETFYKKEDIILVDKK